jgi:hypothetical protein
MLDFQAENIGQLFIQIPGTNLVLFSVYPVRDFPSIAVKQWVVSNVRKLKLQVNTSNFK